MRATRALPILILATAAGLAGCSSTATGSGPSAGRTPNLTAPTSADVTLVVRIEGSDLPGSDKNNHPSPRQLYDLVQPSACRVWMTNELNSGGWVAGEIHMRLAAADVAAATAAVENLRGVKSVQVTGAEQFPIAPTQPADAPGPTRCQAAVW